ncbi:hypothetical protein DYBT9623_04738 [Dyadobacter sp. CECT 9623]|uniref:CDP-Glycerol:Poly(Glycerophosphate) glycerophosphotransferase n=1 Tax=Dyadobacter linearis TaxID=2823330 RepID=A0ABM8UXI0_9BACT|nr:hypothetical protein [Dyadobacter sp. CECT 9623]CAG5073237.1 hypothetical protein DYBT9623_04738 [Dyadobacter sp. CECT 9623]
METIPKRRLLILITNQFAVLNMIHTGFLEKLSRRYDISLISDLINKRDLASINEHFNCSLELLNTHVPSEIRFLRFLRWIEKVLFFMTFNTSTRRIKVLQLGLPFRFLLYCFDKMPIVKRFSRSMLSKIREIIILISSRMFQKEGQSVLHFDGILSSSPLDIRENIIVNFLIRYTRIPAMGVVISWDNLTSKGLINSDFDQMLVWNQQMAAEFEQLYSFCKTKPKICVSGVPRFDIYFGKRTSRPAESGRKTILFATSAPKHFPDQYQIVEDLREYMQTRNGFSLLIRCHPADDPDAYRQFAAENVEIWPSQKQNRYSPFPALDFLEVLADTLFRCDVCLQVASTMRLDAAACNKPTISIAYDGNRKLPYAHSVRRLYSYSHQIPLNRLRLDHPVFSKKELFECLDKLLVEDLGSTDHRLAIQKFIHHTEAKSVNSMIQYVDEWLT